MAGGQSARRTDGQQWVDRVLRATGKPEAPSSVSVLIADAQPIFRQGVRSILSADPTLKVVGEAADVEGALKAILETTPHVAIVDVALSGDQGLALARQAKLNVPTVAVIVTSPYDDEEQLFEAMRAGAAAYLPKDASASEMLGIVRRVSQGEYLINDAVLARPAVASKVLQQFQDINLGFREAQPIFAQLSPREVEVLDYIARGNSNKEIARALGISDQTVKNHVTSIMRKLAVNDRTQAVVYALRQGWIKI